jgi:tetratricopeptide (TPR) repeat protein
VKLNNHSAPAVRKLLQNDAVDLALFAALAHDACAWRAQKETRADCPWQLDRLKHCSRQRRARCRIAAQRHKLKEPALAKPAQGRPPQQKLQLKLEMIAVGQHRPALLGNAPTRAVHGVKQQVQLAAVRVKLADFNFGDLGGAFGLNRQIGCDHCQHQRLNGKPDDQRAQPEQAEIKHRGDAAGFDIFAPVGLHPEPAALRHIHNQKHAGNAREHGKRFKAEIRVPIHSLIMASPRQPEKPCAPAAAPLTFARCVRRYAGRCGKQPDWGQLLTGATMSRFTLVLLLTFLLIGATQAQQAPPAEDKPKVFASYDELFDDFSKRREVLVTRYERLVESPRVEPAEIDRVEADMRALDREYARALRAYVDANPDAADAMFARYEIVVTWSRLDDRLEQAIAAADEFIERHSDAELVPDARFLKAQTLFRIPGREREALASLDQFLELHDDRPEAPAVRMMRVRTLLFMDRVGDARRALRALLETTEVKEDEDAEEFLRGQLNTLDWIGRELPAFTAQTIGGEGVSNSDLRGKPLLLVIYDSTSPACLGELPYIEQAMERFGEKINVLGVSINESRTAFEQWLERNSERIKFRNIWIDREQEGTLLRRLDVTLIPFNVLVDAEGRIYRYDVRSDDMLRYAELLAE